MILTLPMARMLKELVPDAFVAMLIRRYTRELVEGQPDVDAVHFYDADDRPRPFLELVRELRSNRYDVAFHPNPRFRLGLLTFLAGIPVRVGTGYRWYSFLFSTRVFEHRKDGKRHELEYNFNLLRALKLSFTSEGMTPSMSVSEEALQSVKRKVHDARVAEGSTLVLLHPGSGGSARDWSPENFGLLARKLSALPGIAVILTGGAHETALTDRVRSIAGSPRVVSMAGMLTLPELAALAKMSAVFVGNSTGPIHIAAAVGTAVVGLYPQLSALGATRWGPLTAKRKIFSPIDRPTDCSACEGKGKGPCDCMDTIGVDQVFESVVTFVSSGS